MANNVTDFNKKLVNGAVLKEVAQHVLDTAKAEDAKISQTVTDLTKTVGDNKTALAAADAQLGQDLAAEVDRAKKAEQANAAAITAEVQRATGIEGGLDTRLKAVEASVGTGEGSLGKRVEVLEGEMDTVEASVKDHGQRITTTEGEIVDIKDAATQLAARVTTAEGDIEALEGRAGTLETTVSKLDGAVGVEGSVRQQISAAETRAANVAQGKVDTLAKGQVKTNKSNIEGIQGKLAGIEGTVQAAIDAAVAVEKGRAEGIENGLKGRIDGHDTLLAGLEKNTVQLSIDQAEVDAKKHAEDKVKELAEGQVADNKANLETLMGTGDGSIAKAIETAVAAEKSRAEGAEGKLRTDLATEAGHVDALQAQMVGLKKDTVQAAIDDAQAAAEGKVTTLANTTVAENTRRIAANETKLAGIESTVVAAIDAAIDEVNKTADGLVDRVAANEDKLEGIESTVVAAISAAETRAANTAQGKVDALANGQVKTNKENIAKNLASINGLDQRLVTAEGEIDDLQAAIETLNGAGEGSVAKAVADAVAGVIDGAPEKFDTLKEISDFIQNDINGAAGLANQVEANKVAIETLNGAGETSVSGKIAKAVASLQSEIDGDVKEEADRAKAEEQDIRADFAAADATLKSQLQAEIDADVKVVADELAKQKDDKQDGTLAYKIAAEASRAAGVERGLQAAINQEAQDREGLRNDVIATFNGLNLDFSADGTQVSIVLEAGSLGTSPLGTVGLPVMTSDDVTAMLKDIK